jgi:predicted phosphohydrolase
MLKLVWLTDIHLNHLKFMGAARAFGEYLAEETKADAYLITGDISEAPVLEHHLEELEIGLGKDMFFVLGNHDYYRGSFEESPMIAGTFDGWLDDRGPRELSANVALVGNEGWYDAHYGEPYSERFGMTDWVAIQEYKEIPGIIFEREFGKEPTPEAIDVFLVARKKLIEHARERSAKFAAIAKADLERALTKYEWVIFATHYPPFKKACWHEGEISGPLWLPWFTSKFMGDMLKEVAAANPQRKILVLCGHTHSSGLYEPLPNLHVVTGEAVYGAPDLAGVLEIHDHGVRVAYKNQRSWKTLDLF